MLAQEVIAEIRCVEHGLHPLQLEVADLVFVELFGFAGYAFLVLILLKFFNLSLNLNLTDGSLLDDVASEQLIFELQKSAYLCLSTSLDGIQLLELLLSLSHLLL